MNLKRTAAGIYVPRTHELGIDAPPMRIEGWLGWKLIDARTGRVKQSSGGMYRNLITNVGLDNMAVKEICSSGSGAARYMAVGTGSTAPANGDTALVAEIANPTVNRTESNATIQDVLGYTVGPPDYHSVIRVREFSETQGNGNLTECGFFDSLTGGVLFMRQLFKDVGGTPISITKTSADKLQVTWEIRAYPPATDVVATVAVSAVNYDVTMRACGVSLNPSPWLGFLATIGELGNQIFTATYESATLLARNVLPTGTGTQPDSKSTAAYVSGNYYLDDTLIWEPGTANFATGIGRIEGYRTSHCMYQHSWNPKLPKDSSKRLTLTVRRAWARH